MARILSLLFLWFPMTFCLAQNDPAKAILLRSKAACENVKSASFSSRMDFVFFGHSDTIHLAGRLNLLKSDTNASGVIGRMLKGAYDMYQYPDKRINIYNNTATVDTVYYSTGFAGNIHDGLFNIGFMKPKPFEFLSEKGHAYQLLDTSGDTYRIKVLFPKDKETDQYTAVFTISKSTLVPVETESGVRLTSQNEYQYRHVWISNLSLNDDSALYHLNHVSLEAYDSVTYTKRYIPPALLDSGTTAPDWCFPDSFTGDSIKLSRYRGKYVLMDFWYIACYPCMKAIPSLVKLQKKFKDKLVVIGIDPFDTKDKIDPFYKKNKMNYTCVSSSTAFPKETYNVSGYPTLYLVNPEGIIIKTHVGFYEDDTHAKLFEQEISSLIR